MTEKEFKDRTKEVSLRVIRLVQALPKDDVARTLGKQLLRSGTSVGANYRAACRGKSPLMLFTSSALLKKKRMKVCSGWSYWLKQN